MAYKFNDSALYVTGSVVLSSSLYMSWGEATGSAATVGIRQNCNGTLEYKDHSSGSWTEFGDSLDDTMFGDESTDVFTFIGQITASEGALIKDDKELFFGDGEDASIKYDENGTNRLVISGSAAGIDITGSVYISGSVYANEYIVDTVTTTVTNIEQQGSTKLGDSADDTHEFTGSLYIADDSKIYFGANQDASIEYDEDGTDELRFAGAAATFEQDVTFDNNVTLGVASTDITTVTSRLTASQGALIADDVKLYFGTNEDAYIEYDEDGTDELIISGAEGGIDIQGPAATTDAITLSADGTIFYKLYSAGSKYNIFEQSILVNDDVKLYFGTGADASIEYDEDGTDELRFAGAAATFEQDVTFDNNVTLGVAATDVTTVTSRLTASQGALIADDTKLWFGTNEDAYIEYDEASSDELIISGALGGIDIQAPIGVNDAFTITSDGANYFSVLTDTDYMIFWKQALFVDDTKLYFGLGSDASIEYDEDGTDELRFAGAAATFEQDVTFDNNVTLGVATTDVTTVTGHLTASQGALVADDVKLYFGTGEDASIEYDEAGTNRLTISGSAAGTDITGSVYITGSFIPGADDLHDLGSTTKRWANIYTGDLHLKNNKGDWTILEEENYLCVINNKTNKRYKMMLEEIED